MSESGDERFNASEKVEWAIAQSSGPLHLIWWKRFRYSYLKDAWPQWFFQRRSGHL